MEYTIQNEELEVRISELGGEMQSIRKSGTEYLWQGDPQTWPDRAINIFPYVARLTDRTYTYRGNSYEMEPHGFLPHTQLTAESHEPVRIAFRLDSDAETERCYPFVFTYRLLYELQGQVLHITSEVENRDQKAMYFGLGGHPGFRVPLEADLKFQDYYLEFDGRADCFRIGMSDACFVTGADEPFPLEGGVRLPLSHDLFDQDAIILRDMYKAVTLRSDTSRRGVKVSYPDMNYLGIWHWPRTEVDYVCIEPWTSLPSREGIIENLEKQADLVRLEAGAVYRNSWSIEII